MKDREMTIAIVGSTHAESLHAMAHARSSMETAFRLYGNAEETKTLADNLHINLDGVEIIDTTEPYDSCLQAAQAADINEVQALMKGSVHTADFLRAILDKQFSLLPEGALLSHVARLELPWYHKSIILSDAAVSILPDIDHKVQIIQNAVMVSHRLGTKRPKVALVCPVETVNPRIVSTTDASQLVFLQQQRQVFAEACVEGPFGLDVALSAAAAQVKHIAGEVPGDADILVFGNIDAANATYKAFLSAPGVRAASIVVGAKIPIILTSRSESKQSRVASMQLALSIVT
jgi:phosphate butyryltransferase